MRIIPLFLALVPVAAGPEPEPVTQPPPSGRGAVRMEADASVVLRALGARLPGLGEGFSLSLKAGRDPAPVVEWLTAQGAEIVTLSLRAEGARVQVTLPSSESRPAFELGLKEFPEVARTSPWSVPVTLNDDSIWVGQSYDTIGRTTPIFDHGITGTGEIVAVYDTGMDPDMCQMVFGAGQWSPAQILVPPAIGTLHTTEKVWAYYLEPGATLYDYDGGHGSAVAGSVLGDNWLTPSTPTAAGHDGGDGMAPNARLILMDGGNFASLTGIVGDLTPMFQQAWDAGARVENHSWGSPGLNLYAPDAADIDRFMWRHEDMLFVNAAGNSGGAPNDGSVIDPAVSKNSLAVGATSNGSALANDLAGFTSRGPTFDGRIRPDVVAPGENIRTAGANGVLGDDTCGGVALSGTSLAAPTVSGWAALVRQYFRDGFLPSGSRSAPDQAAPSAALIKAALIASAVPIGGNDPRTGAPVDPPPSFNQGWGRPVLDNALYFAGDPRRSTVLDLGNARGIREGGFASFALDLTTSGQPLEVAVAWTDPPSEPGSAAVLVNDLDLVVTDPVGTLYRGNVWSGGQSVSGGSPDSLNPVEVVRIEVPSAGRWTVRVEAPRPLGVSGVPGIDGSNRQGFGLIATYPVCTVASGTPAGVTALDRANSIDLSWNAVTGALGYYVYRADALAAPGPGDHLLLTPSPVAGTSFSDSEVHCGTAYSYVVRAWNGCALSAGSVPRALVRSRGSCALTPLFSGLTDARPGPSCGQVELQWPAATSRCPCSTGVVYNVWAASTPIDPAVTAPLRSCVAGTGVVLDVAATSGLQYFLVRAEDRVPGGAGPCGGVSDGNLVQLRSAPLSPTRMIRLADHFEAGRGLWSIGLAGGGNAWDIATEANAASPSRSLTAADLGFVSDSVAALIPVLVPTADSFVAFHHTFDLEGRFDGGVVEISTDAGANWSDAGGRLIQGRYNDWLMTGPANRTIRPGFTAGSLGPMAESLLWLGDLAGQSVHLRFRMLSDGFGRHERWAIDDVQLADRDCPAASGLLVAAFENTSPACTAGLVEFDARPTYGGTPPYSYTWDFGDGSPTPGSSALVNHAYATAGTFDAVLTVRDSLANQDSVTLKVRVVDDSLPPAVGNNLMAVAAGADVVLSWTAPPGAWQGTDVLSATLRDQSDLAPSARVPWDLPAIYVATGALTSPPETRFWRVRELSGCLGTPGPI